MPHARTLLIPLIAWFAVLAGCGAGPNGGVAELYVPAKPDAAGPRLTASDHGPPILSWMEPDSDGHTLWYSTLADDGWQTPRAVVTGRDLFVNWADLPSVMQLSGDHWAAHWLEMAGDTTYAYHVMIAQSFNNGFTWSEPVKPHTDATPTEHGFVSLYPDERGLSAIWLDGRKMLNEGSDDPLSNGMTLRAATLDRDGGLHDDAEIDDLVCDCCQTDAALTSEGPLVLYRNRTSFEIRDIYTAHRSESGWQTGTALHEDGWKIGGCPVNGPAVAASGSRVAAAWFTAAFKRPRVQLKFSDDGGDTFGDATVVAREGTLGHVDILMLDDGTAIVSWLESAGGLAELRVRRFGDGVWSYALTVAEDVDPRSVPQMALDGDRIVFLWTARLDGERRVRSGVIDPGRLPVK